MNDSANDEPNLINQTQSQFISSALRRDLTLLCLNELSVGRQPLRLIKKQSPLFLRYETDGVVSTRNYLSPASWRAKILFDVAEGKDIRVLEMDRLGRYKEMFPDTLLRRLLWHSRPKANFPPVARLYDPNGDIEILLNSVGCVATLSMPSTTYPASRDFNHYGFPTSWRCVPWWA